MVPQGRVVERDELGYRSGGFVWSWLGVSPQPTTGTRAGAARMTDTTVPLVPQS